MTNRREILKTLTVGGALLAAHISWPTGLLAQEKLPRRRIPGTADSLPVIGLGNSNAFRENDLAASAALIELFHDSGGAYIDCMGPSRFVVAEVARQLNIGNDLFLGTYFVDEDGALMRKNIQRLLEMTGKQQLDLVHAYPEFAAPNWRMFRQWKDEGLTRYIGVARHRSSYYEAMMKLMETGTVDFLQVNYSPLETEADQQILPMALDKGVAVTINRCDSWAQFSLKFILSNPAVTCVLTETANPRHATDNIGAGFGRLPDEKTRQKMVEHLQNL
jgi:diketogulonate reductase-like aldo/keto reductase